MTRGATWFELATMSQHVYRAEDRPVLPASWQVLMDAEPTEEGDGYFAAAYWRQYSVQNHMVAQVVIAHRGTNGLLSLSAYEDMELYLYGTVPHQFYTGVVPFVQKIIAYCEQRFGDNYSLEFTGHSLGAVLAELSLAKWCEHPRVIGAVSFESPGTRDLIQQLIDQQQLPDSALDCAANHLVPFATEVNAINSAFMPLNNRREPHYIGYDEHESRVPLHPDPAYFLVEFSVSQHHMQRILDFWREQPECRPDYSTATQHRFAWPVGFDQAYHYFKNYRPWGEQAHADFWDGYAERAWQRNPSVQAQTQYHHNVSLFAEHFRQHHLLHDMPQFRQMEATHAPATPLHAAASAMHSGSNQTVAGVMLLLVLIKIMDEWLQPLRRCFGYGRE